MLEIKNAKIENVTMGFDDRKRLSVSMSLMSECSGEDLSFILTSPEDVNKLKTLFKYTESNEIHDLNGKIIRKVVANAQLHGFGHPIEDKFINLLTEDSREYLESEFLYLFK